jgi:DNA invertase Pin-like site-specific DNA recombinase
MPHKQLIPAAAYIRMSGRQQDKSPAEQRAEIGKLAAREGCQVVAWYADEAVTGDSGTDERPGLAALLADAKARKFTTLLCWHTNRLSRQDPWDAVPTYNTLRKAGVGLITCCEGRIDLADFAKQLLLFIGQKGNHDFLREMSQKTLRGRIANAKAGGHNGGPAIYGMDRGLFGPDGKLVRRLQPGEYVRQAGHRVHLLPSTDKIKVEAVRYAFERYDQADIGLRDLAWEMEAKGFPSPRGKGWSHSNVGKMLRTKAYIGTARWGARATGKYHLACGEEIVAADGKQQGCRRKPEQDVIAIENAHTGIIPVALFNRVQAKLPRRQTGKPKPYQPRHRGDFPLSGLMFCQHCNQPMYACTRRGRDRHGRMAYTYHYYVCSSYVNEVYGSKCGRHPIDADIVMRWLTQKLQEEYLGPGRDALVREIRKQLKAEPKTSKRDAARLEKRLADLEKEVGRLVKAIRTLDADELVEELSLTQAERDRAKAELAEARKLAGPVDLDAEAERIADRLWEVGERLGDSDPAVVREVVRQFVSKITCRWETKKAGRQIRSRLVGGTVELWPQTPFSGTDSVCSVAASMS